MDVEHSNGCSSPILTARQGDPRAVETLLGGGANVDKQSLTGQTACIEAIRIQGTDVAEYLVERVQNPAIIDVYGRSYFDWVAGLDWDGLENSLWLSSEGHLIEGTQNKDICLAISEIKVLRGLDSKNISQYVRRYEHLGRPVRRRKKYDNACTAFERSSSHMRRDLARGCNDLDCFKTLVGDFSLTSCFVCCVFTEADFCESCMQEYNSRERLELARLKDEQGIHF